MLPDCFLELLTEVLPRRRDGLAGAWDLPESPWCDVRLLWVDERKRTGGQQFGPAHDRVRTDHESVPQVGRQALRVELSRQEIRGQHGAQLGDEEHAPRPVGTFDLCMVERLDPKPVAG